MFKILQVSRENIREIFNEKKSLSQMIENCLIWPKMQNKFRQETAVCGGSAAVSSQFILFSTKATDVQNFRAVTLLWTEIMRILLLV